MFLTQLDIKTYPWSNSYKYQFKFCGGKMSFYVGYLNIGEMK